LVTPLLSTKLFVPPIRPELVPRPRLTRRLNAGLLGQSGHQGRLAFARKLTLVSAPAGFGKTTLLSDWVSTLRLPTADPDSTPVQKPKPGTLNLESQIQVAWLSLDKGDDDAARFWSHFIAALQTLHPDVGETALAAFQSPQSPPIESILTGLINEIIEETDGSPPSVLILDDCHLVEAQAIYDALAFLLDHLPPQLHLVIATRADPPLPLSRLRGQAQLAELRTADLRFTPDEAAHFLNRVMGLDLSAQDVAALEARTEGWIVGLQMAALTLRGRDAERVADFVTAFTGSHRYVMDYLTDEVLLQQPEHIQTFLLRTAILDRLTAPLCDAIMTDRPIDDSADGQPAESQTCTVTDASSEEILQHLERNNLFLVPLDDERKWYRYHHLFADLLRKRLEQTQPDVVPGLHHRASRWYETHGMMAEAVGHALAADDADRAARMVEGNVLTMMDHGELAPLLAWLEALPDAVRRRYPWLCVAHAWALAYSGQLEQAALLLQDAEDALNGAGRDSAATPAPSPTEARHVAGHIATIRGYVAALKGDDPYAAELARRALDLLPEDDLTTRGFAARQLAFALRASAGLAAATEATMEASAISRAAGDSHVAIITLCDLAGLLSLQGHLHEAAAVYEDALQLAHKYARQTGRPLPATGYVYGRMSTILKQWHDLETATRYAKKGVELCRWWGWREPFVDCCIYLATALGAMGDERGATETIQEAKNAARGLSPWFASMVEITEAVVQSMQDDMTNASRWAAAQEQKLGIGNEPAPKDVSRYLAMVRILIAQAWAQSEPGASRVDPAWQDKLRRTLKPLAALLQTAEEHQQVARACEIQLRQALILQALGQAEEALTVLARVLSTTQPEGHVRAYVSKGAPMARLLRQAAAHGIAVDYVGQLLAAFRKGAPRWPNDESRGTAVQPTSSGLGPLVESLSERELQVLRLIAVGLSNREIAAELSLAVGTVKRHTSNIYGKLSVRKRTQAVARARELGLL
jgi:LuxR family maltose regulon positive regulatory protein